MTTKPTCDRHGTPLHCGVTMAFEPPGRGAGGVFRETWRCRRCGRAEAREYTVPLPGSAPEGGPHCVCVVAFGRARCTCGQPGTRHAPTRPGTPTTRVMPPVRRGTTTQGAQP